MTRDATATMDLTPVLEQARLVLDGITSDSELDLRGLSCPLPPLKTAQALKAMDSGQVLEVLGTSPLGKKSAPWFAQRLGHELIAVVEDHGFYRFYLRKK